ncbi:MAG: STM4012 family radical SAM protein [Anaerolineae bacterium]|nr:STM4012 family radical SAM protein [Anaerolineae bacterium]
MSDPYPPSPIPHPPYVSYTYAYPHKTTYRPLTPPISLRDAWKSEDRRSLFLYFHIPFCEMRCGFCNLFTTAQPPAELVTGYLSALRRQSEQTQLALGDAAFARMAIGGGTPTCLEPQALDSIFDMAQTVFDVDLQCTPVSVETSPATASIEKLSLLAARGIDRISIGIQSFIEAEVRALGRSQTTADALAALERIRSVGFPTLNIDLIYGAQGQTVESWLETIRMALTFSPEELYLYPLYVRPLTGLGRQVADWADARPACYRAGRDVLLSAGYTQLSMRMFRAPHAPQTDGPVYCCQEDGMVGMGCGARSYTRDLHYSAEYAVGKASVRAILSDYVTRSPEAFSRADYGIRLDAEDRHRRYVLKSLLRVDGLSLDAFAARFGIDACQAVPELDELPAHNLAYQTDGMLRLTAEGLERSDAIGPWLYSERVRGLMEAYELR